MDWKARVHAAFAEAQRPDPDVVEELAQHLAAAWAAARDGGAPPAEADALVERQLAEWRSEAAALRRPRRRPAALEPPAPGATRLAGLGHELRHAARALGRQPAAALVVVLTLALGVGVTTTLLSVVTGVLLRPLPWPHAERLVRVSETREGATRTWPRIFTNASYHAWREAPTTIDALAAWSHDTMTLAGAGEPERLTLAAATASLFPLLEARAELGRTLSAEDEAVGGVVVLSHELWQRRFGGDRAILGHVVQLDGEPHRIVGVLAPDFAFPDRDTRAWVPLAVPPVKAADGSSRGLWIFSALARLRPGATPEQAALEANARAATAPDPGMVVLALFGSRGAPRVSVEPLREALTADVRPALLLLLAAVALLLVAATANAASVLLARATARRQELAVRAALGAGRARLAHLLLAEGLLLGALGALAGLALAAALHAALPALLPAEFPRQDAVVFDAGVAVCALLFGLAAGLVCALPGALVAARLPLAGALADDGRSALGTGHARTARARAVILSGQVAVAAILLLGAVQLGRSLLALWHAPRGYEPTNLLTATLPLPEPAWTPERRAALLEALLARLRALPGIREAAATNVLPLGGSEAMVAFDMPARDGSGATLQVNAGFRQVSPGYFAALGLRVSEGRGLADADTAGAPPVLVVNRTFASRYLGAPAVGAKIPLPAGDAVEARDWQVVGVVDDVRPGATAEPPQPEVYACFRQLGPGFGPSHPTLLVRSAGAPAALVPLLRALAREQDAGLALDSVLTMKERLSRGLAQPRLTAALVAAFAASALAIAGVGLFGVLAYAVTLRRREFGVRQALGARPAQIVGLVAGQALRLAGVGLVVGLLAALALSRLVAGLLHGVSPHDPLSVVAVAAIVALLALAACAVPAARAARVDPQQALRAD